MTQPSDPSFLIGPSDGRPIHSGSMVHKVGAQAFGGALLIVEGTLQPGELIPPHMHSREDECTYVLSGHLTFEVGGEILEAGTGSYVLKPRNIPHAFWNSGPEPARVQEIHTPGGLDRYYDELYAVFESTTLDASQKRAAQAALHGRYGITFHGHRIPELMARYGVRP